MISDRTCILDDAEVPLQGSRKEAVLHTFRFTVSQCTKNEKLGLDWGSVHVHAEWKCSC